MVSSVYHITNSGVGTAARPIRGSCRGPQAARATVYSKVSSVHVDDQDAFVVATDTAQPARYNVAVEYITMTGSRENRVVERLNIGLVVRAAFVSIA